MQSGEYIDILSQNAWKALGPPIAEALRQAQPAQGPIADVGAGSGLGTLVVAETLPDAEIIAVEPSPILRAVLLSRLVTSADLRLRVTVQPTEAQAMALPDRLGGVLAINMIGHLSPVARRELWARLRPRLAPSAPLIVNLQPPAQPATVPETTFASVLIGGRTYQGSGAARPAGDDTVIWTMRYQTLREDGHVEHEFVADYPWQVLSPQDLRDELTTAGYTVTEQPMDIVVATPDPTAAAPPG